MTALFIFVEVQDMRPKEVLQQFVEFFNLADVEALAYMTIMQ